MAGDVTRADVIRAMTELHDTLTTWFAQLDGGGTFAEDRWERPGGGGGVARVMSEGLTFEKAGINRSAVMGLMPDAALARLGGRGATDGPTHFFAAGVSLVIHPHSAKVPTVHLNVRYFELTDADGTVTDRWFGGGTDLTPYYPHADDVVSFHRALRDACARYSPDFYAQFKRWCDSYFVNVHRGNEARGVGGIFFDNLRPGDSAHGLDASALLSFQRDVVHAMLKAYGPIVEGRRHEPVNDAERDFQLVRRGRYVEFNLVHDRGTLFGLQTDARVESVLMSLPPLARWRYAPRYPDGSFQAQLIAMLAPRDWADVPHTT